jgi:hypothetical protein
MANYKALRNLTIGEAEKEKHKHVKKGEVFSVSEEYANEHLHPHDHVEETDEPVTEHEAVKKVKAAKAAKEVAKTAKKDADEKASKEEKKDKK